MFLLPLKRFKCRFCKHPGLRFIAISFCMSSGLLIGWTSQPQPRHALLLPTTASWRSVLCMGCHAQEGYQAAHITNAAPLGIALYHITNAAPLCTVFVPRLSYTQFYRTGRESQGWTHCLQNQSRMLVVNAAQFIVLEFHFGVTLILIPQKRFSESRNNNFKILL